MILLFTYNRPNIWPIQDIGLLRAISKNYKKISTPEKFVNKLKKNFRHIVQWLHGTCGEVLILNQFNINCLLLFGGVFQHDL